MIPSKVSLPHEHDDMQNILWNMHKQDDVIKWKHIQRYRPFVRGIHRSPVNSPHKGQWRGTLMFSLMCARINGWVNNNETGDLRRHCVHYDVTVMRLTLLNFLLLLSSTPSGFIWITYLNSSGLLCWHWDHDDVIKWKHFPRYWPFVRGIHRSPVNSPHKGQWRGALMFSLICTRINGWVNNGEAGDLRRHRAHYDVTVLQLHCSGTSEVILKNIWK